MFGMSWESGEKRRGDFQTREYFSSSPPEQRMVLECVLLFHCSLQLRKNMEKEGEIMGEETIVFNMCNHT